MQRVAPLDEVSVQRLLRLSQLVLRPLERPRVQHMLQDLLLAVRDLLVHAALQAAQDVLVSVEASRRLSLRLQCRRKGVARGFRSRCRVALRLE